MQHSIRWLTCILFVATLAACGSEDEEEADLPEVDCTMAVPTFGQVTAFSEVCTNCHSTTLTGEARNDAPTPVNFDTYENAKAYAEKAAEEVFEGEMPPADTSEMLTVAQEEALYLWALCGTPE